MFKSLMLTAIALVAIILLAVSMAHANVPGLTEVSGFVCSGQADAEAIGEEFAKGGNEAAGAKARQLASEKKCGTLTETKWAIAIPLKQYVYLGEVVQLMKFDVDETTIYYGLARTKTIQA